MSTLELLKCDIPGFKPLLSHSTYCAAYAWDPATPVIMVATGTGIAPMRSYYRRFFVEDVKSWEYKVGDKALKLAGIELLTSSTWTAVECS